MQKVRKEIAVQMKDKVFSRQDSISVINVSTEFKRTCHLSLTHEGCTLWLFRKFITGRAFATINAWLTVSSNYVNRHEGTIIIYAEVVNHLFQHYGTGTVIAKGDQKIQSFKQV